MQLSRYLKIYDYEGYPDYLLLFSTKQVSKVLIPKDTFQSIEDGTLSESDTKLLADLGMIVPDREVEKQEMMGLYADLNAKSTKLNITAVLNLDCNFACLYCFEGSAKGKLYMSDKTAEQMTDFIKELFTENKDSLEMTFYGGEPLLSMGLIRSVSTEMKSFAESRGAAYTSALVSNGSLFKREVAEELVGLGLETIKVTLDGPAEIHNKYRPFKSGAGSFDTIIANIKETCDLLKLSIGGNFEKDNYDKFTLLLDYLEKEGITPDKLHMVKFDPVSKRHEGDLSPGDYREGCMSINEPWLAQAAESLREEILKRGYDTPKPRPMFCMAEKTDSYVINYNGVIYRCPAFVGKKGFDTGDIETGATDHSAQYNLGMWNIPECAECVYLPICFGGCRYMTYVRDGNLNKLDCNRDYFEGSLETLIKQDIKYPRESPDS